MTQRTGYTQPVMREYCKIHTLFKRDEHLRIIEGDWSLPEIEYLADTKWQMTEKVDGQNIRVQYDGTTCRNPIAIGGRTKDADLAADLLAALRDKFEDDGMLGRLEKVFKGGKGVLFGEGFGPGINGGGKYGDRHDFVLFDVYVPTVRDPEHGTYVDGWWLHRKNVEDVSAKLKLDIVPLVGEMTLYEAIELVRGGFKSRWGDFYAEGLVAKTPVELFTRKGERLLTKVKHKDFINTSPESRALAQA